MSKIKLLLDVVNDMRSLADSIQAVAEAMMGNEPVKDASKENAPEAKSEAPQVVPKKVIPLEQVRSVLAKKSHEGLTAEVRALLQKYGAAKLSEIDPQHFETLMEEAEGL